MRCPQLGAALAAVVMFGFAGCARSPNQPRVVGPVIGESTAQGPSNSSAPPPDAGGVTETSDRLRGTPSPVANPVITVDTMPSTLEPSGNSDPNAQGAPVVVTSGVISGTAPVGTGTATGTATAGPNGPGTGNTTTPTGAATSTATPPGSSATVNAPSATAPSQPTTPTPAPSNGPGTGNTVNRATPAAPASPVVTPR